MKHCSKCNLDLKISQFSNDRTRKDGKAPYCRICCNRLTRTYRNNNLEEVRAKERKKSKIRYRNNKRQYRDWELKRLFGISIVEYEDMLKQQNYVCKICKKPELNRKSKTLSVDHNHKTGKVRGLLCSLCNLGLGYFKDSAEIIQSATNYLEKHGHEGIVP